MSNGNGKAWFQSLAPWVGMLLIVVGGLWTDRVSSERTVGQINTIIATNSQRIVEADRRLSVIENTLVPRAELQLELKNIRELIEQIKADQKLTQEMIRGSRR